MIQWQLLKTQNSDQPTLGHISPQSLKQIKDMTFYVHSWWWAVGSEHRALLSAMALYDDDSCQPLLTNEESTLRSPGWAVLWWGSAGPRETPGCARRGDVWQDWGGRPHWPHFPLGPITVCFCLCSAQRHVLPSGARWLPVSTGHGALFPSQLEKIKAYFLKISTF